MGYTDPAVTDFQNYFVRDFPYGTDITSSVTNSDITNALLDASLNINQGLFTSQASYTIGFLNLAAHYLVLSIRASSQGLADSFAWAQAGKSVGSVSETQAIPNRILENPAYAFYAKTSYGMKYLMLVLPTLCGQVFVTCGATTA